MSSASNVIEWQDWGQDAFSRAEKEKKPVLLDLFGTWCHWCHEMDNQNYSHPGIASFIRDHFVPVKVDTDRRPDVNARYNMGGWPTTAVLSPKGAVLQGATFLPPGQFLLFLKSGLKTFQEHQGKVEEKYFSLLGEEGKTEGVRLSPPALVEKTLQECFSSFDAKHFGFGQAPKFPRFRTLAFLLDVFKHTREENVQKLLEKSLDALCSKGLFDRVEGGFFRYCTLEDWSGPHYEKMLEDQAQAITLLSGACRVFGKKEYQHALELTLRYLFGNLLDEKTGAFFSSQDADEDYYLLPLEKRRLHGKPAIDPAHYTDLNAQAAVSLFRASAALSRPGLRKKGLRTVDFLLEECFDGEGVQHFPGSPSSLRLFRDHAWLAACLVEANAFSGQKKYLDAAREIAGLAEEKFFNGKAFVDLVPEREAVGPLLRPKFSVEDNSIHLNTLLKLSHLLADPYLEEKARKTSEALLQTASLHAFESASFSTTLLLGENGILGITLEGSPASGEFDGILEFFRRYYDDTMALRLAPASDTPVSVQLCLHHSCLPPLRSLREVKNYFAASFSP